MQSAKATLHHTGRFKVRFRVQQRQWRKEHPDAHSATGVFCYQREYAVMVRDHCWFFCLNDQHNLLYPPRIPKFSIQNQLIKQDTRTSSALLHWHFFDPFFTPPPNKNFVWNPAVAQTQTDPTLPSTATPQGHIIHYVPYICYIAQSTKLHSEQMDTIAVFAPSNAAATIYFINQFSSASIQEQQLFNSNKILCKYTFVNGQELN